MAFVVTLSDLLTNVTAVATFFVDLFIQVADMLFSSPFVIFIGLSIVLGIVAFAMGALRIRRGGRR